MSDFNQRRRLVAILVADAAGYSRLMADDEFATLAALDAARAVFRAHIESSHGRVIDTAGDSVLAVFELVTGAVSAALAIQQQLDADATGVPENRRLRFRIGAHLGEIIEKGDGTIYGDGVNVAARLQGLAAEGGICISSAVYDAVDRRLRLRFEPLGEQRVKNIDRPIGVYAASNRPLTPIEEGTADSVVVPDRPAIAVLPFENMSGERDQEYFSDGITDDITTGMCRIPGLFVVARNSAFTYKGKAAKTRDVCRDLDVRYVLQGSIRKSGARIRVTAQLVDGVSGGQVWAERYDRELADVFAVQDDVTEHIVRALEVELVGAGGARPPRIDTVDPVAYDYVLRAREQYRLYSKDGNAAARGLYERAIELAPHYAEAHAGLAETYWQDWFLGNSDGLDRAFELARTAQRLDPDLPLVYEALSSVHLFRRQHDEALAAARRWVATEPGNAEVYANLAGILHFSGEPEQVAELIERAKRLNPHYPFYYNLYVGQACFTMRRFEEAVRFITRSVAQNPESLPSHFYLAASHGQLGADAPAREALAEILRISPDFSVERLRRIAAYRRPADLALLIDGLRKAGLPD